MRKDDERYGNRERKGKERKKEDKEDRKDKGRKHEQLKRIISKGRYRQGRWLPRVKSPRNPSKQDGSIKFRTPSLLSSGNICSCRPGLLVRMSNGTAQVISRPKYLPTCCHD